MICPSIYIALQACVVHGLPFSGFTDVFGRHLVVIIDWRFEISQYLYPQKTT